MRSLLVLAILALLVLASSPPASAQGRPDCAAVIRQIHKVSGHNGAQTPDPERIAEKLGVEPEWVERCAVSYGRRVKRHRQRETDGERNTTELTEKREFEEYEELAREEREQAANRVQEDLDNGVYATRDRGIDPDSSAEWEPFVTHEWQPRVTHEWHPFVRDDDDPGFE